MTPTANLESSLTLADVARPTAGEQLRAVPPTDPELNYLASLAYDAISSGLFGEGPFEITLAEENGSFAIICNSS